MKLAIGAPVAERGWILPTWFDCIAAQTLQPDYFCFVYSKSQDDTFAQLQCPVGATLTVQETILPYHSREARNGDPKDPWRARHMTDLRNKLKTQFMRTDADIFVSWDTDILMHDPQTLEQLVGAIEEGWDVACALTHLHALGAKAWCPNAGIFTDSEPGPQQGWRRAERSDLNYKHRTRIDIPMACYAIRRHAMGMCAYSAHSQGEDVGFAQSLRQHKAQTIWCTNLEVEHIWGPSYLVEKTA